MISETLTRDDAMWKRITDAVEAGPRGESETADTIAALVRDAVHVVFRGDRDAIETWTHHIDAADGASRVFDIRIGGALMVGWYVHGTAIMTCANDGVSFVMSQESDMCASTFGFTVS